jgi:polyphosphate glucokinase
MKIMVIDIGGTKVKALASGQTEPRKAPSGRGFTPTRLVEEVRALTRDWEYEAISIGYPGLVGDHGPRSEPGNLGAGWVGFNFAAAFERPVRVVNDAAMQALGSYDGGRMLFLGLGTGLGSALIAEKVIVPLELGRIAYRAGEPLGNVVGRRGLKRLGKAPWRRIVREVVTTFQAAFEADYVVLGGGNAKRVGPLPHGVRLGHNLTAFRGGFRLWGVEDVPTLLADGGHAGEVSNPAEWRLI